MFWNVLFFTRKDLDVHLKTDTRNGKIGQNLSVSCDYDLNTFKWAEFELYV